MLASICSTKNGFPSAAPLIRSRAESSSAVALSRLSIRTSVSASPNGSSKTHVRPGSRNHSGRVSRSSGRARQRTKRGTLRDQSARYSIRSSSVGSAQCASSSRRTSGRVDAIPSSSLRSAQNVSSLVAAESATPMTCAMRSATSEPSSSPSRSAVTFE